MNPQRNLCLKFLLSIGCFLLLIPGLHAQSRFQKHYDYNNNNLVSAKHFPTNDGGFIIFHPVHNDTVYILKTDKDGNRLWSKKIPATQDSTKINLTCVTELPDSSLVFGGSLDPGTQQLYKDFFFMKLTKNGVPEWSKFIPRWGMIDEIIAIKYDNNVIYAVGQGGSMRALSSDMVYLRLDASGKVLSMDDYPFEQHRITDMEIKDGWAYISGTQWQPNQQDDPLLITADANGNFRNLFVFSMKGISSGTFVTKTGNKIYFGGNIKDGNKESIFYLMMSDPETPWPQIYELKHPYRINNAVIKGDAQGNLFFAGGLDTSSFLISNSFITKIENVHDIKWTRIYKGGDNQHFNSLSISPADGSITACGVTLIDHIQQNNIYLVKTDKEGKTGCKEDSVLLSPSQLPPLFTREVIGSANSFTIPTQDISITVLTNTFEENFACFPEPPNAGFSASDTVICLGECITVTDTSTGAAGRKWIFTDTPPVTSDTQKEMKLCFIKPGYHKVMLAVRNSAGTDTAVRYFRVHPLPDTKVSNDTTICQGELIKLKASGGIFYKWSPEDYLNKTWVAEPEAKPLKTTRYYIVITGKKSCRVYDSVLVNVLEPVSAPNSGFDTTLCLPDSIILDAGFSAGNSYNWSTGQTTQKITAKNAGKYEVTISNACFSEKLTFNVKKRDCSLSFYIPNAFTPNSNVINDHFEVVGENISEIHMRIYNRWKQRIFDERGKEVRWDGSFNGERVQAGVYLYIIEIIGTDGRRELQEGTVHLER